MDVIGNVDMVGAGHVCRVVRPNRSGGVVMETVVLVAVVALVVVVVVAMVMMAAMMVVMTMVVVEGDVPFLADSHPVTFWFPTAH